MVCALLIPRILQLWSNTHLLDDETRPSTRRQSQGHISESSVIPHYPSSSRSVKQKLILAGKDSGAKTEWRIYKLWPYPTPSAMAIPAKPIFKYGVEGMMSGSGEVVQAGVKSAPAFQACRYVP